MKVALVCDWLTNVGGAEKVLLEFHKLYPKAPIFTSKYDPKGITWFKKADVRTGWLQIFPTKMRFPGGEAHFSHMLSPIFLSALPWGPPDRLAGRRAARPGPRRPGTG